MRYKREGGAMKKKSTAKIISDKSKKKEIEKKIIKALRSPKKTISKKREIGKVKPKAEKKSTSKKITVKAKVKVEKKPERAKVREKQKKVAKKVIAEVKKKPEQIEKKTSAKIAEKSPPKAAKKAEAKKIVEKPAEKVRAKIKAKPAKVTKKIAAKVEKKVSIRKVKKVEIKKTVEKPRVKVEEKYPPTPLEALPTEYGENGITLMTVDPYKLFAFWEVREDTLSMYSGDLNVRVYDVTGIDFDGMNANSYFDIAVNERIGSLYIDVSPEKEFVADIGIVSPYDIFITIARSNKVSTPRAMISEEGLLPQKLYETGLRVGY